MKKSIPLYLTAALPLIAVNALCLSIGYFTADDLGINATVFALFAVVAVLIAVTKLFFDFFAVLICSRCTAADAPKRDILDILLRAMLPQWIATLVGLLLSHVIFPEAAEVLSLVNFAVAHTVYYGCTGFRMVKRFGKRAFGILCGTVAAVCWIYAICSVFSVI